MEKQKIIDLHIQSGRQKKKKHVQLSFQLDVNAKRLIEQKNSSHSGSKSL